MQIFKNAFICRLTVASTLALLSACGGGGSSDSGILFEGTLIEGETTGHVRSARLRHGAGETIAEVTICALGECAVTDSNGQWGFVGNESFTGGDVAFTLNGHGIENGTALANIPQGSNSAVINFERHEGSEIHVTSVQIEGGSTVGGGHGDHEHEGHHE